MHKEREERFDVVDDATIFFSDSLGTIQNINNGGLAAECMSHTIWPEDLLINIGVASERFFVFDIPVRLAWQGDLELSSAYSMLSRKVGFEFKNHTNQNLKSQLDNFIKKFTKC